MFEGIRGLQFPDLCEDQSGGEGWVPASVGPLEPGLEPAVRQGGGHGQARGVRLGPLQLRAEDCPQLHRLQGAYNLYLQYLQYESMYLYKVPCKYREYKLVGEPQGGSTAVMGLQGG